MSNLSPGIAGEIKEDRSAVLLVFLEVEPGSGIMLPKIGPCLPVGPEPAFRIHPEPDAIRTLRRSIDPTQLGVIDPWCLLKFSEGSKPI